MLLNHLFFASAVAEVAAFTSENATSNLSASTASYRTWTVGASTGAHHKRSTESPAKTSRSPSLPLYSSRSSSASASSPRFSTSPSVQASFNHSHSHSLPHSTGPPPASSSLPPGQWWFPNLDRSNANYNDYVPFLGKTYDYQVYVAVHDASGLVNAIASGGPFQSTRENGWLAGQPRVIYVAPGTYELSSTLYMFTDTLIIGDATDPPTISASSDFNGDTLIVGGQSPDASGNGGEVKFSTMIKNVILDTTDNARTSDFTALSWRVAQNSGLVNVQINLPRGVHTGISMGQGSTVQVGDTSINYGNTGLGYYGSQQATLKNLKFKGTTTGIQVTGGNTINIVGATFDTVGFPIVFEQGGEPWVSVIDATSINSGQFLNSKNPYPNFMLENIDIANPQHDVVVVGGNRKIGPISHVGTYVYGNTVGGNPIYQTNGHIRNITRPSAIAPSGTYPIVTANQYPDATVNDVINLKDTSQNGGYTLKGDGFTNDGPALESALEHAAAAGKIAFLPYGIYRTMITITIPPGTELIGNGWSTISGYGSNFKSEDNPTPVVQVGNPGDTGTAHIQDMRFTVGEELPGAIILQINLAGEEPGDVSVHNSLITVGGTRDTEIDCNDVMSCQAAYVGMHLSTTSSAYIDNVWVWVADHASDGSSGGTAISAKGGVLIEATKGTWLSGLASEHFWLYNVAWNQASNVFMSLLQSETNYLQGSSGVGPPSPWHVSDSDPDFSYCSGAGSCEMTVGQYFNGGSDIFTYGAASWNIFGGTQLYMNVVGKKPVNSHFYGLCSGGTNPVKYVMRLPDGSHFGEVAGYSGSWGNLVAEFST